MGLRKAKPVNEGLLNMAFKQLIKGLFKQPIKREGGFRDSAFQQAVEIGACREPSWHALNGSLPRQA